MYIAYQNKQSRILAWILSLVMMMTLFAGFNLNATAADADPDTDAAAESIHYDETINLNQGSEYIIGTGDDSGIVVFKNSNTNQGAVIASSQTVQSGEEGNYIETSEADISWRYGDDNNLTCDGFTLTPTSENGVLCYNDGKTRAVTYTSEGYLQFESTQQHPGETYYVVYSNNSFSATRTKSNATRFRVFKKADESADPEEPSGDKAVYQLTDELKDGKQYLIVSADTVGTAYGLNNPGGTSSGAVMGEALISIKNGSPLFIETDETNLVWTAKAHDGKFDLTNNSDYLEGYQGNVRIFNEQNYPSRGWNYTADSQLQYTGGEYTYTVYYNNGYTFTYNSTSSKVYIYEKVDIPPEVIYTITFVNDDESLIDEQQYKEGTKAEEIEPPKATKKFTDEYTYEFAGWDPAIADVTEDATYKATYTAIKNKYNITFIDDSGHKLRGPEEYEYGTKAEDILRPEDPPNKETEEYIYEFNGWDPEVADVTTSATYRAAYEVKNRTYTVIWKNGDDSILEKELNVLYGHKISYTGNGTPTKAEDDKYTYTFEGWDPEIPEDGYEVKGDTTFTPVFTAVEKEQKDPEGNTEDKGSEDKTSEDKKSDDKKSEEKKKTDDNKVSPNKEAPSAEELAKAPINNTLPVINPEKIKTTGSMSKQTMTIKLGKLNADNCLVEYKEAKAKTWKSLWYGKGSSLVIKNMKKNGFFQYRFTTVKLVNGKWTKSRPSNICYRWIRNVKAKKPAAGKKSMTVKWKKVKKASGYEIQYAANKSFTKKLKKVTVKGAGKTSRTIKKLKKGKTYYVRIRPYKTKGGKKYLGILTVAKKVKVK